MIEQLQNGERLITLGNMTVLRGIARDEATGRPVGVYFGNLDEDPTQSTIIRMDSMGGIASYMLSFLDFVQNLNELDGMGHDKIIAEMREYLQNMLEVANNGDTEEEGPKEEEGS